MVIKSFVGDKWWEQKNPAYREACKKKHGQDLVELKGKYDYLIKVTKNKQ